MGCIRKIILCADEINLVRIKNLSIDHGIEATREGLRTCFRWTHDWA